MASGGLLVVKSVLDIMVGDPPPTGTQLLAWSAQHHFQLAATNEVLAFAAVLLIPAVHALYRSLNGSSRPSGALGCGLLAVSVPIILVLVIVHGRLMYPVYGINVDNAETVALVVSLYHGGMHEVSLILGAALITVGIAMRRSDTFGRAAAVYGVAAGGLQIIGAFPWLIGAPTASIMQASFAAWLIVTGLRLTRLP